MTSTGLNVLESLLSIGIVIIIPSIITQLYQACGCGLVVMHSDMLRQGSDSIF